jgi:RNA polymerase sigma-70 factor (ECF subfamily)
MFQEIVYQLWRSFPSYRGEASAMTWVYRIALNTAITAVRKRARRPVHVPLEPSHDSGSAASPIDDHSAQTERLYRAIRQLNTVDRALVMCYLDGMSYRRIGEILGISEANVGTRLNRTRMRLQDLTTQLE